MASLLLQLQKRKYTKVDGDYLLTKLETMNLTVKPLRTLLASIFRAKNERRLDSKWINHLCTSPRFDILMQPIFELFYQENGWRI